MSSLVTNKAWVDLSTGAIAWASATVKLALCTSSYTPSSSHQFVSDLTNELSGGGYARPAVGGRAIADDLGSNAMRFTASDVTLSALGVAAGTPRYAAVFKDTGSDATSPLIAVIDLGSPPTPDGSDYEIAWDADGVIWRGLWADDFNRADATTLGAGWTARNGLAQIVSNQAKGLSPYTSIGGANQSLLTFDALSGMSDVVIQATAAANGAYTAGYLRAMLFRYLDISNWWEWIPTQYLGGGSQVYKYVGGAYSGGGASATYGNADANGDTPRIVCFSNQITIVLNGSVLGAFTDSFNATAGEHGLVFDDVVAWENFRAEGAFTIPTPTASLVLGATAIMGATSPAPGETMFPYGATGYVEFQAVDVLNPVTAIAVTANGLSATNVGSLIDLGTGLKRQYFRAYLFPEATMTFAATSTTSDAHTDTGTWSAGVRPFRQNSNIVDYYTIVPPGVANVVEFAPVAPDATPNIVEFAVKEVGYTANVVEFAPVDQTGGFENATVNQVDLFIVIQRTLMGLAMAGEITTPSQTHLPMGGVVRATAHHRLPMAGIVSGTKRVMALAMTGVISRRSTVMALAMAGEVVRPFFTALVMAAVIEPTNARLIAEVMAVSLALQEIEEEP